MVEIKQNAATSDSELVRNAKNGDLEAFEALVSRHERRIYALARRITDSEEDAEDVTQQTFLSAVQNLAGFKGSAAFSTWLVTIAANAALKILRKRRGMPTSSLDEATDPDADGHIPHPQFIADWREGPDRLVERKDTRRLLDAAVSRLDPGQRAVFLLRDVEGLSVKETAKALGLTETNVKVKLLRSRLQLRERLTKAFGDTKRRYTPQTFNHRRMAGNLSTEERSHA